MMHSRACRLAPFLLALTIHGAAAETQPPAQSEADPAAASKEEDATPRHWKPVSFHVSSDLRLAHESNLFHVRRRRENAFSTQRDVYERYHGMKGPDDWATRIGVDLSWRWKHVSKRAIELRLRARQEAWHANSIANRNEFALDASFDLTRADRLRLGFDHSPRHFLKNYSYEAFPGISIFERADASDFTTSLEYARDWGERWSSRFEVARRQRQHAAPFRSRDQHGNSWAAGAHAKLAPRFALEFGVGASHVTTATTEELGISKDRSYDERSAHLELSARLPHGWRLQPGVELRKREYLTQVADDTSRYGRTDRRWTLAVQAERKLTKKWTLSLEASQADNASDRMVPATEDDVFGYRDVVAAVGIAWQP